MVDQQLRVDPEKPVQKILVPVFSGLPEGAAGNIAHGKDSPFFQLFRDPASHAPEVPERPVGPEAAPVAHLIQLRDPHAVLVRFLMLCQHVHGDLREVEIGPDACGGGDARFQEDLQNQLFRQLPAGHAIGLQVLGCVDQHLVDGVDVDVLGSDVPEIDLVDAGAVLHVQGHAGRRGEIIRFQRRVFRKLVRFPGLAGKTASRRVPEPSGIDLFHSLDHFKKAGTP